MSDLVERLRSFHYPNPVYNATQEAADRIEALEAALWEIAHQETTDEMEYPDRVGFEGAHDILVRLARAALDKDAGK
jgi:hypothetical protein